MKRIAMLFLFITLNAGVFFAAEPEFSGILDSTVNYIAGAENAQAHSFGIEEYANLRLRFKAGEKAAIFAAFNIIAMTGNYALPSLASGAAVNGGNYAAAMEPERLYFRINGEYIDTEAGLLRINFGYGQVWGSSDFLNPRNPLYPNARPRGVLGADASFYPEDSLKLMIFAAAPRNPLQSDGGGFIPGFSMDRHWDRASLQALYAFETPLAGLNKGTHRFGLSLKGDLKLGLAADALYILNPAVSNDIEGLSAGAGFDYSFFDGALYILFEYLFNGSSSVTAWNIGGNLTGWKNHNYLYGTALYRLNDFCSLSFSMITCFDDWSFSPFATLNYEVFQGLSLSLTTRICLDQKTLSGGKTGEMGPAQTGARLIVNAGARLRF